MGEQHKRVLPPPTKRSASERFLLSHVTKQLPPPEVPVVHTDAALGCHGNEVPRRIRRHQTDRSVRFKVLSGDENVIEALPAHACSSSLTLFLLSICVGAALLPRA
jgi:hypothetical protein